MTRENKKTKFEPYKTFEFPYMGVRVEFADMSQMHGLEIKGEGYTCIFDMDDGWLTVGVFVADIAQKATPKYAPLFAHEMVHVLQAICEARHMKFENEIEHMAYIMSYILEELFKNDK